MAVFTKSAQEVYAPTKANGDARGADMGEAQVLHTEVERAITGAEAGRVDQVTWAELEAVDGTREGQPAQVLGPDSGTHTDPVVSGTVANTGTYVWSVSPEGWRRVGGLPSALVHATNSGAGSANAVQATTAVAYATDAYSALITVNFVAANTGAMTLSLDGETARDLVTNTGAPITSGYIASGMSALVQIDENGDYRLFSYGDASAIQAAAEAAQAAAEAAAASIPPTFASVAAAEAATVGASAKKLRLNYYDPTYADTTTLVGGGDYRVVPSEPSHDLKFQSDDNYWFEINEEIPNETQAGAIPDDDGATGTDNTAAIQKLIDWAMIAPKYRKIRLVGRNYCASDLTDFHNVRWCGPGSIRMATGRTWWAEPGLYTNTYSTRQTLYVSPSGDDTASGLSPSAPLETIQQAADLLARHAPLRGMWGIELAAGTYEDGAVFYGVGNNLGASLWINGPAVSTTWDNTSPPASASTTGTGVPTAILRPALADRGSGAGWAIDFQGSNLYVNIDSVQARDWGEPDPGTGNEGAFRVWEHSKLLMTNVHVWDSDIALCGRSFTDVVWRSGHATDCRSGLFALAGCRYDINGQAAGTTGPLFEGCLYNIDVWEGGHGHWDYSRSVDPVYAHAFIRKGGHLSATDTDFVASGATTCAGIDTRDMSNYYLDATCSWTGQHYPRYRLRGSSVDVRETSYSERMLLANYADQSTSGTTELTIGTLAMEADSLVEQGQALHARIVVACTNTNAAANIRLRAGGSYVALISIPINCNTVVAEVTFAHRGTTGAATNRFLGELTSSNSTGSATKTAAIVTDTTTDLTSAASMTWTIQSGHASDSFVVKSFELWRRG